jgi:amino acid permease
MFLSMYTSTLLLDSRLKLKANSYTDLGMKAFGKPGKIAVNLALALCQIGFVCAYIYFIKENLTQIFYGKELKVENEESWVKKTIWVAVGEFFIYAMLSYVRKI